jgi:argininosuccinate lyase
VQALAADLGFSHVVFNSIDASSDRDFAASFLFACSMTMVHLSRMAEDLILFCGEEHRFFELSDALSTGSSMMPQKKNPDPLELVRGKAGRAAGHLMGLLMTIKGLPSGYNKDLQEDKQAVFDAEDTMAGCLSVVAAVIEGLSLNRSQTERAASGLLLATDVADYLVERGIPFRRAHEIVGALVRKLVAENRDFSALSRDEWQAASDHFGADVVARVTPAASVAAKRTPQSTAPVAVRLALDGVKGWLEGR